MSPTPKYGFMRINQILGDKKASPPLAPIIPICKSAWWKGISLGKYPKPIKLGPKTTVWRVEDILDLIKNGPSNPEQKGS